jgi:uncharacterized protein YkwD
LSETIGKIETLLAVRESMWLPVQRGFARLDGGPLSASGVGSTLLRVACFGIVLLIASQQLLFQAPVARADSQDASSDLQGQVLELTNQERARAGLQALQLSPALSDAAQAYSTVLATGDCFDHTCGVQPELGVRLDLAGYQHWTDEGEIVAAGLDTPSAVVSAWMNSPEHRSSILSESFTEVGIGFARAKSTSATYPTYWTADFGTRPSPAD